MIWISLYRAGYYPVTGFVKAEPCSDLGCQDMRFKYILSVCLS
jgi:hypothetical protein